MSLQSQTEACDCKPEKGTCKEQGSASQTFHVYPNRSGMSFKWGLRSCISHKLPRDVDAMFRRAHFFFFLLVSGINRAHFE